MKLVILFLRNSSSMYSTAEITFVFIERSTSRKLPSESSKVLYL